MKRMRMAVIGVGHLGQHHARVFAQLPRSELRYVVDIVPERAHRIAQLYRTTALTDYRDIPFRDIDAVSVVTPTATHYEIVLHFLHAGIPVFVEKPMTSTAEEAQHLVDMAARRHTLLAVGHIERFNPVCVRMPAMNMEQHPMFIEIHRVHPFVPRGIDVDIVTDLMIHDLDLLLMQLDGTIEVMDAVGIPVVTPHVDVASVRLKKDLIRINLVASRVSHFHTRRWMVFSAGRYLSLDFLHRQVTQMTVVDHQSGHMRIQDEKCTSRRELLALELETFLDSLERGYVIPPLATGAEGLRALQFVERIVQSMAKVRHPDLSPWVMPLT